MDNYARRHRLCEWCGWPLDSELGSIDIQGSTQDPEASFCQEACLTEFDCQTVLTYFRVC